MGTIVVRLIYRHLSNKNTLARQQQQLGTISLAQPHLTFHFHLLTAPTRALLKSPLVLSSQVRVGSTFTTTTTTTTTTITLPKSNKNYRTTTTTTTDYDTVRCAYFTLTTKKRPTCSPSRWQTPRGRQNNVPPGPRRIPWDALSLMVNYTHLQASILPRVCNCNHTTAVKYVMPLFMDKEEHL